MDKTLRVNGYNCESLTWKLFGYVQWDVKRLGLAET